MNRYDSYKDSGVAWLGEVPSHWECVPIRAIFGFRNEKNDPIKTDNILSLSIANGVTEYSEENRGGNKRKDDLSSYKLAYPNDIVLNSMNVIVGAVGISKYFGAISPVYYALYLKDTNNTNLSYYDKIFKNENFQRGLLKFGKGILIKFGENGKMNTIRMKISQDDLKTLYFPIPPLSEQTAIAQYLDNKTAKIDRAIELEQQQIELLKEYKQILIQTAVTRGLNPDVALKDSGVEWLGEVPEHWEIKQLKFESNITLGKMLCTEYKHGLHLKPYLKSKNIQWLNVNISSVDEMYFSDYELKMYKLEKGDLILSEGGEVGKTCIWNNELEECYIQNSAHKVRFFEKHNSKYFLYLFFICGKMGIFDSIVNRVSIAHLTKEKLENMKFVFPTLSEQTAIAQYLDEQTTKIDHAINIKLAQIEKLKEYKTVLINEVVTGKRRVVQN